MKISVILPCYNGAATIAQQMDALCRQSWAGNWELIFVNNGSTDNSVVIVEQYRPYLPALTIVQAYKPPGPRFGAFHSYNEGFKVAIGDAFVLCEADDEVGEGWLQAMGDSLLNYEFVVARMDYRKLNAPWLLGISGKRQQETEIPRVPCYPYLLHAWGCTFGFRRSVYEKLGGFNPTFSYAFDADYCWRAQEAGIELQFIPEAVIHYRLRSTLKAHFQQKLNWGEEFQLLYRAYREPSYKFNSLRSKLGILKLSLNVLWLFMTGLLLSPYLLLDRSDSRTRLFSLVEKLGWQLGEIKGKIRALPPMNAQTYSRSSSVDALAST